MGDALLAFNFSTCCEASDVVIFLKVNGLEGFNVSFIFSILGC